MVQQQTETKSRLFINLLFRCTENLFRLLFIFCNKDTAKLSNKMKVKQNYTELSEKYNLYFNICEACCLVLTLPIASVIIPCSSMT